MSYGAARIRYRHTYIHRMLPVADSFKRAISNTLARGIILNLLDSSWRPCAQLEFFCSLQS